jgi:hypothetical protein
VKRGFHPETGSGGAVMGDLETGRLGVEEAAAAGFEAVTNCGGAAGALALLVPLTGVSGPLWAGFFSITNAPTAIAAARPVRPIQSGVRVRDVARIS